jgi:hypothetical protein
VDFYNVQSKFTDVSGERAVFIFRVEADLIAEDRQLQELHLLIIIIIIIIIIILLLIYVLKPD